jgi:hypothetical protein
VSGEIFDLDAVYAEERREPFRFKWAGKQWELPHFSDIDWRAAGLAADIEALADEDGTPEVNLGVLRDMFRMAFGEEQAARWEQVPQNTPAMIHLFQAWQEHSGMSVGESQASPDSSGSTVRRSKRTSTGTTASASAKPSRARKTSGTRRVNSSPA